MSSDRVIPVGRVFELLKAIATQRGIPLWGGSTWVRFVCRVCYPDPPGDWITALRNECEGFVTLRLPRAPDSRALMRVSDVLASLEVTSCCHDDENALGNWYWRSDLEAWIDDDLTRSSAVYEAEWAALEERAREAAAEHLAIEAAFLAGQALTLRQRVQAVAGVLKADGHAVQVDQARVSWECEHVDHEGGIGRLVVIVTSEGLPRIGDDSCTLHEESEVLPNVAALTAEYQRVADMTPEERAAYKTVPEAKGRGGGASWRGRGRHSAPKAPPKPESTPESDRSWFTGRGIDIRGGIRKLEGQAQAAAGPGGIHPSRAAIKRMKDAYPDG